MKLGDEHPIAAPGTLKGFNYNTINIELLRGSGLSLVPFPPISLGVNNIQSPSGLSPQLQIIASQKLFLMATMFKGQVISAYNECVKQSNAFI